MSENYSSHFLKLTKTFIHFQLAIIFMVIRGIERRRKTTETTISTYMNKFETQQKPDIMTLKILECITTPDLFSSICP